MKQRISMCLAISLFISLGLVTLVAAAKSAAAAEPIKIGAVFSVTGWAGPMGTPAKEAVEIATDEINKKGGVLGRKLEVYYEDDQSNPTNSAIAATKLIRDRNVCILLGSSLTVFTMPMVPVVEREQITLMAFGAGHELTSPIKKWVFRIPMTDYRVSPIMLKFATQVLGAKKLALLHSTDSSGTMGAKGVVDTVANYGASVIITERFEPMSDARRAARTNPRMPVGRRSFKSVTKIVLGSLPGNSANAITPGSAKMKTGANFRSVANIAPHRACFKSRAPSTRCTFTWSIPQ